MKVLLAILSDIHFSKGPSNPIPGRVNAIVSAIASTEVRPDAIVLLFCGDIANFGLADEFGIAKTFINVLRDGLAVRFPSIGIHAFSVPGNHDLEHEENSEDFRKKTVDGSKESMRNPQSNLFYLKQLLDPQKNYWEFAKNLDFVATGTQTMICRSFSIQLNEAEIHFNLINSALLSQKHEQQGSLLLPLPMLQQTLTESAVPHLTITVMHHPSHWIESQTLTNFRDLLARTTDYLITGHEHFSSGYEVKTNLGENIRYFESPALFDPKKPLSSAFRVLVFDFKTAREKHVIFDWAQGIYKCKIESEFEWRDLSMNRIAKQSLTMNAFALSRLNDPGFASPRNSDRPITLQELFEYPDLKLQKSFDSKEVELKRGKHVFSFLTDGGIKEVHGAPLSGKTTLSKALVLNFRLQGSGSPIWLDGKTIRCSSIEDFEATVRSAVRELYSSEQLDSYFQLLPESRCVVIDDWHLAAVSTSTRDDIYDWLTKFAKTSILFVDATYQIRELLVKGQATKALSDPAVRGIVHTDIASLSHVSKASLIHKYLKLSNGKIVHPEESKESREIEILVSQMLDADRLPAYPFFILCMLQAIEGKQTNAIAGGSHGPLYEVLILSALTKPNPDDPQISNKIVFLQEIAYQMWSTKMSVVSPTEIRSVMEKFTETTYQTLPTDRFLKELADAKIISTVGGNYTFAYAQYLYYFIAHYLRDHLDEDGSGSLRAEVDMMIDEISSVENSAIVMFLIYFEKDKNRIIDRLVRNASNILRSTPPAQLQEDASDFSNPTNFSLPMDENPDIAENRQKIRVQRDERDAKRLFNPKDEFKMNNLSAYSYSEELPEHCKLHLVTQSINALGQVIRNFSANLPGPRKVEVLKETYLLALRALSRVMELSRSTIKAIETFDPPTEGKVSFLELKRSVEELFTLLPQLYAITICHAVSGSVGIANMDRAYIETAKELDQTVAVRLIDLTVQMNYFEGFPEKMIRDLREEVRGNRFSAQILEILVVSHLLLNKVEDETRKRIALILGVKSKDVKPPAE